jgi:hypothetical protein
MLTNYATIGSASSEALLQSRKCIRNSCVFKHDLQHLNTTINMAGAVLVKEHSRSTHDESHFSENDNNRQEFSYMKTIFAPFMVRTMQQWKL